MISASKTLVALGLCLAFGRAGAADEPASSSTQSPVPVTREDVKKALEGSKHATPRLPRPPLTEEEKARAAEAAKAKGAEAAKAEPARGLGGGIVNNGRMRSYYLSAYSAGGRGGPAGFSREPDPSMTLGYPFTTRLFWIVSRANNCTYCLGHQEAKLASTGMTDDQIGALDGDWAAYGEADRAAFAFTKKLCIEPHAVGDADIAALRAHFNDAQIAEIILSVAGFDAMNRWTGSLRIPQEDRHVFLKPTSPKYAALATQIAPVGPDAAKSGLAAPSPRRRPALEPRAEVESALEAARARTPRLKIADESAARALLNGPAGDPPAQWARLLCVFPKAGPPRVAAHVAAEEKGTLDARTKAIIAWVCARNDRAWYALGHARRRLQALGLNDDQIFALDDPETLESPADREVVGFARKLTVDPPQIDDDDIARLRKLFDDRKVAEIVYQVTEGAFFDRLTEASGLRLED